MVVAGFRVERMPRRQDGLIVAGMALCGTPKFRSSPAKSGAFSVVEFNGVNDLA